MTRKLIPYKSYMFRNKDPIIDKVRTVVQESKKTAKSISADSGVSAGTMDGWFKRATKRPQHATVNAVLRACGYDLKIVRKND